MSAKLRGWFRQVVHSNNYQYKESFGTGLTSSMTPAAFIDVHILRSIYLTVIFLEHFKEYK